MIVANGQRFRVARMQAKENSLLAYDYVHILNSAAALFVESDRNAEHGSERPNLRATTRAERGKEFVLRIRVRLAMIADQTGNEEAVRLREPRNVRMANDILAVLVMRAGIDGVAYIMQYRRQFEGQPEFVRKAVNGSELIKEISSKTTHLFRVRLLIMKTRGDAARFAEQRLKAGGVGADDCAGKLRRREVPQDSLFDANSGHQEGSQMKPLRERGENHGSDADDFGAITAKVEHVHALGDVEPQNPP